MTTLLTPREVDQLFRYPRGRSVRLARAKVLPAVFFPDGQIRFEREAIERPLADMTRDATRKGE